MDPDKCSICLTTIQNNDSYKLKCGHVFRKECILKWQNASIKEDGSFPCPICRSSNPCMRIPADVTIILPHYKQKIRKNDDCEYSMGNLIFACYFFLALIVLYCFALLSLAPR